MASKPKELSNLQRDLLHLALQGPKAKIWLPKASQQSFPTTYAAIVSLQRRGLLDTEPVKDPDILSWKVTKEGRDALKAPKAEPADRQAGRNPRRGAERRQGQNHAGSREGSRQTEPPAPRGQSRDGGQGERRRKGHAQGRRACREAVAQPSSGGCDRGAPRARRQRPEAGARRRPQRRQEAADGGAEVWRPRQDLNPQPSRSKRDALSS